ncbi:MAG: hypothetical protein ACYC61_10155 [Isosphaeraceae bacterium]
MSRAFRFSIARLMGVVILAAMGVAALRQSSEAWAGSMLLITLGAIAIALTGAFTREPAERAGWLGFALFGGGYLALAYATSTPNSTLPTLSLAQAIEGSWHISPPTPASRNETGWDALPSRYRIVHLIWALGFAGLGSVLSLFFAGGTTAVREPSPAPDDERSPPRRGRLAILAAMAAFWMLDFIAVARHWPRSGLWAGAAFLVACGALGLIAAAAVLRRGRIRESYLAAAFFGFGYLALTFGQPQLFSLAPHLPTEGLIHRLVPPGMPPIQSEFPDFTTAHRFRLADRYVRRKLDELIPMHFPNETPLDDVLKHIRKETSEPNLPGIPMYVDPIGLQVADRSLSSPVQMDFEAIPVRDALRLILKQLGLGYTVQSGFVIITDEELATIPVYADPIQVVSHSLLALVAAGIGALAARLVSDRGRPASITSPL